MKKQVIAVIVVAVVGIGVAGGFWVSREREKSRVEIYNGVLEATEIDVRAQVGGQVVTVLAEEGDKVLSGQTICELDRSRYELQLRAAEAQLTAQSAKLEAMENGAREQELKQVEMVRDQAQIQKDKTEKDYDRLSRAAAEYADGFSEYELDTARAMKELAEKNAERAQQAYDLAVAGVRDEEKRAQISIKDAYQAQADLYKIQLDDTVIKSPISGRLIERYVEPGELVMPGGLIATVANYRKLKLKVYVPVTRVGGIKIHQKAAVMIDAFPGKEFRAWVTHKSKQAEFTPKNVQTKEERSTLVYEVTVVVDNPTGHSIAGLPADVKFLEGLEKIEEKKPEPVAPLAGTTAQPGTTAAPGTTASAGTTAAPGTTATPGATAVPAPTTGATVTPGTTPAAGATPAGGATPTGGATVTPAATASPGSTAPSSPPAAVEGGSVSK